MLVIGHTPHLRRKAFMTYFFFTITVSVYGILVGDNLRQPPQDRFSRKLADAGVVTFVRVARGVGVCTCMELVYGYSRGKKVDHDNGEQ
jgi:hypothetical protein